MLVVAAGTGLGGCLVLGGVPVGGARHAAGHFGHIPAAEAHGLTCSCGRTGHLETIASGPGLLALYRRRGGQAPDARYVAANADSGELNARDCLTLTGKALGRAIGGWVNMLDPDAVIVTGGLADAGPLWWSAVTTAAREHHIAAVADCPLVAARYGTSAAIIGAAALARDAHAQGDAR